MEGVGTEGEICVRCFWRASCWECRRRYFCSAKPLSGFDCVGLCVIDIVVVD